MKVNQIIQEYRRDVTLENLGDKLLDRLATSRATYLIDDLYGPSILLLYAKHPEHLGKGKRFDVLGKLISVTPENVHQVVQQMRQPILDHMLAYFESRDPTKTKTYVPWLLRSWVNDPNARMEDVNRNDLLSLYQSAKNRNIIRPEHRDINKFKSWKEFENTIRSSYSEEDLMTDAERKQQAEAAKGQAEQVYEDSNVRVIHPQDEKAACYYGQGTQWCTAATRGNNMFERYNRNGPMFIFIPKNPQYEGEKYQIHLSSGQLMNEQDSEVTPDELRERFPNFSSIIKKLDPENADSIVEFADPKLLKRLADEILDYANEKMWEIIYDWETSDDYWHDYQVKEAKKKGYVDSDGEVDWDQVHEDDDLNDYLAWNYDANDFVGDFRSFSEWSGNQWKTFVIDVQNDYDQSGFAKMDDFEYAVAEALDEKSSMNSMKAISDYIKTRTRVYKDNGEWKVELMKGGNR